VPWGTSLTVRLSGPAHHISVGASCAGKRDLRSDAAEVARWTEEVVVGGEPGGVTEVPRGTAGAVVERELRAHRVDGAHRTGDLSVLGRTIVTHVALCRHRTADGT